MFLLRVLSDVKHEHQCSAEAHRFLLVDADDAVEAAFVAFPRLQPRLHAEKQARFERRDFFINNPLRVRHHRCVWLPSPCPADDPQQHWKLLKPQEKENNNQPSRVDQAQQSTPGCCCSVDVIKSGHVGVTVRPSWCSWSNWDSRLGPRNRNEWTHYRPAASAFVVCVQQTQCPATLIFIRRNVLLFPERNQDRKENTSCLSIPGPSRGPAGLLDIHQ